MTDTKELNTQLFFSEMEVLRKCRTYEEMVYIFEEGLRDIIYNRTEFTPKQCAEATFRKAQKKWRNFLRNSKMDFKAIDPKTREELYNYKETLLKQLEEKLKVHQEEV